MQKENLYHHHIIFMVCTCIDHSSQPISTQEITQFLYTVIYPTESVIQPYNNPDLSIMIYCFLTKN